MIEVERDDFFVESIKNPIEYGTYYKINPKYGTGFQTYEATVKKQRGSMMGGSALQYLFCGRCGMVAASRVLRPETFDSAAGRW